MKKEIIKIDHFLLPENYNGVYEYEASSSLNLTKETASKINEIVDAMNKVFEDELEYRQQTDGTLRKAILYMKDNLVNTINDLLKVKGNEIIGRYVENYIGYLNERLNNLLGQVVEGSTTLDAEVIDLRIGDDGVLYDNAGESVREQFKAVKSNFDESGVILTKLDFEQGNYQYSVKVGEKTRLRTKSLFKVKQGDAITLKKSNGLYMMVGVLETEDETEKYLQTSGWLGEDGSTFIIGFDGYAYITIGNEKDYETSTQITISDYNCTIVKHCNESYRRTSILKRVNECEVIITEDRYPSFNYTGDTTEIFFPGTQLYLILANGKRTTIEFITIKEQLGDVVVISEEGITIKIPLQIGWFGVDAFTGEFKYGDKFTSTEIDINTCVLLTFYYGNLNGKLLTRYSFKMLENKANEEDYYNLFKTDKGFMYVSSNAGVNIESYGSNGGLSVVVNGTLNQRFRTQQGNLKWEDITSNISERVTIEESKATIILPQFSNVLVFNITDQKLYIRGNIDTVKADDYILLQNAWSNPIGGYLYHYWLRVLHDELETKLGKATSKISSGLELPVEKIKEYCALFKTSENVESFLFFTDPHLCEGSGWESEFYQYMSYIKEVYESTPAQSIICGGDWIGNSDTQSEAIMKLSFIKKYMDSNFKNYYGVLGNHDTNYQGVLDGSSTAYSGRLKHSTIGNIWFNGEKTYYTFETKRTRFIVLDTGSERDSYDWIEKYTYTQYCNEQKKWLCETLLNNTSDHVILLEHLFMYSVSPVSRCQFTEDIDQIFIAFNNRTSIVIDGETFDFTNAKGKCKVAFAGHTHQDKIFFNRNKGYVGEVTTTQLRDGGVPTFDLVLVDYDNNYVHLIRIGSGENRSEQLNLN